MTCLQNITHLEPLSYHDMVTHVVMSLEDDLARTTYIISLVIRKYLENGLRKYVYYKIDDLIPVNKQLDRLEFIRIMGHSVALGLFVKKLHPDGMRYALC